MRKKARRTLYTIVLVLLFAACSEVGTDPVTSDSSSSLSSSESQIEKISINDSNWSQKRTIRVMLPPDYQTNVQYPVLYVLDGHAVFGAETGYSGLGGNWDLDETATKLMKSGRMQKIIIVAIHNVTDQSRNMDFTPVQWEAGIYNDSVESMLGSRGGGADDFLTFITNSLMPEIARQYSVSEKSEDTAIMGSSFGGLFSFYAAWNHPQVFGKSAVMSPGFFWDSWDYFYHDILGYDGEKKQVQFWLDAGNNEDFLPDEVNMLDDRFKDDSASDNNGLCFMAEDAYGLAAKLLDTGWNLGKDLLFSIDKQGQHNESAWGSRVNKALLFLFGTSEDWDVCDIAAECSRSSVDTTESEPTSVLLIDAEHANQMTTTLPPALVEVDSNHDDLWQWGENWDMMKNWQIIFNATNTETELQFTVSYENSTNECSVNCL